MVQALKGASTCDFNSILLFCGAGEPERSTGGQ